MYGQILEIEFLTKIRDIEEFDGLDALKHQLQRDVETRLEA